jgi:hypothetical protein
LPSFIWLESTKHDNANYVLCHTDTLVKYHKAYLGQMVNMPL